MNSTLSGLNLSASVTKMSTDTVPAEPFPGSSSDQYSVEFKQVLSGFLSTEEGLSRLRELLPAGQMEQIEAFLENGSGLPFSADLAATSDLPGNPALIQWMMQLIEGGAAGPALAASSELGRSAVSMEDFRSTLLRQGTTGDNGSGTQPGFRGDSLKPDAQAAMLLPKGELVTELTSVRGLLLNGEALTGPVQGQSVPGSTPFSVLMGGVESLVSHRADQLSPAPLSVPMGERGWDNVLGNRILWMVGKQMQQATLQVTPRHLGPVDIQVTVQNDVTNVTFTAQNAVAREALEAAIPRLREMFTENNMQLVNVDVGQHDSRNSDDAMGLARQGGGEGGQTPGGMADEKSLDELSESHSMQGISSGLVDDYA